MANQKQKTWRKAAETYADNVKKAAGPCLKNSIADVREAFRNGVMWERGRVLAAKRRDDRMREYSVPRLGEGR